MPQYIHRNSTCRSLKLPTALACAKCKPSLERISLGNTVRSKFKSCLQPWSEKWGNHRVIGYVQLHNQIHEYLGIDFHSGNEIVEVSDYPTKGVAKDVVIDNASESTSTDGEIKKLHKKLLCDMKKYFSLKGVIDGDTPTSSLLTFKNRCEEFLHSDQLWNDNREEEGLSGEDGEVKKRKFKTVEKTISSQKQKFTVSIPVTHELKFKPDVSMLKSKAVKYDKLMGSISRKRYGGTSLGNSMFGLAASMVPQAGMSGVATIAPMIAAGMLANAGLEYDTDLLIESLPGRIAIGDFVVNNAADTIVMMRSAIKSGTRVYLSCDKGNKKGNKNLAKYVSWYCTDTKRVKTYLLDVNCTDENTDDIAKAIKHSLEQTFGKDNLPTIFGQCTDSGGGGTGKKLHAELEKLGLTPISCYLVTSCALHNLQTALRNGVQLVLGEGGLDHELKGKHNAMQCSCCMEHTTYRTGTSTTN